MALSQSKKLYVAAAVAAIAILVSVLAVYSEYGLIKSQTKESITNPIVDNKQISSDSTILSDYQINTQCELLYSMTHGVYPNDTPLEKLNVVTLSEKYPEEFSPWQDIISDDTKLKAFAESGLSPEFMDVFSNSVMKEYSINPSLHETVTMALKPGGSPELKNVFDNENCAPYFEDRLSKNTP